MKHIPSLPSSQKIVEDSGQVIQKRATPWERQRRVPTQVAINIAMEKRERAAKGIVV